ncbi:39871_t:CDS:2 [Gigaspora margarita]|uniref:39871_t:CDS:1 n=1 Tax=Gigaspora margarita TaxID=4874 RepID=A0ABM8W632_GIGMA|nr:39871_t:CDS:2 [Gigaspora margarita]
MVSVYYQEAIKINYAYSSKGQVDPVNTMTNGIKVSIKPAKRKKSLDNF